MWPLKSSDIRKGSDGSLVIMTMVPSRISTWLVLLLFAIDTRLIVAQTDDNPVFLFPSSTQLTAAERGHLSSSSRNGNVFVVAGNVLYRLSSQLQQLQNVSVSPIVALTTKVSQGNSE